MPVDVPNTIDIISRDPKTGTVTLHVSDHLDWNDTEEHLRILQDKLNAYLRFIEGGEVYEYSPKEEVTGIEIQVVMMHAPNEEALEFLRRAGEIVREAGVEFGHRVHGTSPA